MISLSVRVIKDWTFMDCLGLMTAILNNGLEVIGRYAFARCALECIMIPPVERDPKVLRRVSRILIKEGLHFANLFYTFE